MKRNYKQEIKELRIMLILVSIAFVFSGVVLVIQSINYGKLQNRCFQAYTSESNEYFDCSNLNLPETAKCLNNFVRKNFKYHVTDDNITLDINSLITLGGDCKNWNYDLYAKYMDYYGFETKSVIFPIDEEYNHLILLSYDKNFYCQFDMLDINCFEYQKIDENGN